MGSDRKAMATLGASLLCCCSFTASGQTADACRRIDDSSGRLACYDHVFPRAPAPSATDHPAVVGDFGLNQRQLVASGRVNKPEEVQNVAARVTDRRSNADGEFIVTLDNGQVWTQTELDTLAMPQAGEVVAIRRGLLGSFLLVTSHGVSTRVRRLK